ncbi:MAG: hypothetical protein HC906_08160 [Bacteroidales bacterium]|nr:hypothetical protein [Bacteroidales bacterium]
MKNIKKLPGLLLIIGNLSLFANDINVLHFGAKADSITDNTVSFQKAIDEAAITGGTVFVPAGKYLIKGSLHMEGVSLTGENKSPKSWTPFNGTILLATGGKGKETDQALFEMRNSSAVSGITVYYPDQSIDHIQPYPWTFHIGSYSKDSTVFDCTIENVTLINSYNGIHAGPNENGRHRINSVFGCVLRRGIFVESVGDIGRIENVQFHCHFWGHPVTKGNFGKAFDYMQANLEAFIIGRSDWEFMTNTFVFPARIGYHFIYTENGNWKGACNGQFNGIAADASGCCIKVDAIQHMGLLITNGQFNSHLTGDSTQIIINETNTGSIRFENCGFWGPVKHNADIKGDGYVTFQNCYFSNNYYDPNLFSIVCNGGKIQIIGNTFDAVQSKSSEKKWSYEGERTSPPAIFIEKNTKHAIISGNNGYNGIMIKNHIGDKAIINSNELYNP